MLMLSASLEMRGSVDTHYFPPLVDGFDIFHVLVLQPQVTVVVCVSVRFLRYLMVHLWTHGGDLSWPNQSRAKDTALKTLSVTVSLPWIFGVHLRLGVW